MQQPTLKHGRWIGVALLVFLSATMFDTPTTNAQDLGEEAGKKGAKLSPIGYFLGVSVGQNFAQQGFKNDDFDLRAMMAGISDALAERDPALNDDQLKEASQAITDLLKPRMLERMKRMAEMNAERGKLFLQENAKKEGVKTLPSGLQYKVLKEGEGESPGATDKVTIHYTGRLINGRVFDSSLQTGAPATFPLNNLIKG
ncbi:MAG: FKBP-type peptidyl-prolyl cis-trans isomerase N-terminal domain-containing protein, partial [Planctomycetota bacterium]